MADQPGAIALKSPEAASPAPDRPAAPPEPEVDADVRAWVRRAREGDSEAFVRLVERYERMVLRTALRLLGQMDQAQDAAQDAFLRMHRYLDRFDDTRDLGPWLYRLVVNLCRDVSRSRTRLRLVELDEARETPDPTGRFGPGEIEAEVFRSEQRRLLHLALAQLPTKERAALVLRDIEGLPTSEVAAILGTAEGTVRSQVCTARLKIRKFVESGQERRK
jgi:RNA polymerase sigma-70 factor (ECF subfamily)